MSSTAQKVRNGNTARATTDPDLGATNGPRKGFCSNCDTNGWNMIEGACFCVECGVWELASPQTLRDNSTRPE